MLDPPRQALAVAIDDNNLAWMEMLVPFVLSLQRTTFAGELIVLGYGLSDWKIACLEGQGIAVRPSGGGGLPLSTDRFLAAASVLRERPDIDQLALYDADVWFPNSEFDLFAHVTDAERIHCAFDAWTCAFVFDPLIGPERERLRELCVRNVEQHGHVFQAGLIAGGRDAWMRFAGFLEDQVSRIGVDFNLNYGLDTTLLNIHGGLGGVAPLDARFNLTPKWGVEQSSNGFFKFRGQPIVGLHMTGDVRSTALWRYYNNHADDALERGQAFAIPAPLLLAPSVRIEDPAIERLAALGLRLRSATGDADIVVGAPGFERLARKRPDAAVGILTNGHARLEFEVECDGAAEFFCQTHFLDGAPPPLKYRVVAAGSSYDYVQSTAVGGWVSNGAVISLESLTLPGLPSQMIWLLN